MLGAGTREERSQTTYEELKLLMIISGSTSWSCSQTTYEELKHDSSRTTAPKELAPRLPMRNWNSSITKLKMSWRIAPRLPMRNWNRICPDRSGYAAGLPDYLWGIETHTTTYLCALFSALPDYLWGIETLLKNFLMRSATGSQTTYEELKPEKFILNGWFWEGSQTTYEELKPYLLLALLRFFVCSQTTYEELKRSGEGIFLRLLKSSQTTYEELKLFLNSSSRRLSACSQTTYEELKPVALNDWI